MELLINQCNLLILFYTKELTFLGFKCFAKHKAWLTVAFHDIDEQREIVRKQQMKEIQIKQFSILVHTRQNKLHKI